MSARGADHGRWRILCNSAIEASRFPDWEGFTLGQSAREARGWTNPTDRKWEQVICLTFIDACWAYALQPSMRARVQLADGLRCFAKAVLRQLDEEPAPPTRPYRADIDG